MPANYVLLEKVTLTANAASVVLDNIPQTGYTDLKLVASVRTAWATDTNDQLRIQFNGDTGSNYTYRQVSGTGSALDWGTATATFVVNPQTNTGAMTASTFASHELYIPNYTGSTNKSVSSDNVTEQNATLSYASLYAGLWSNTAAITSITALTFRGSGFVSSSSFYLYGIKNS
jgi:hypothetical protein